METNIYAITDSHQESRNLSKLLSGVYNFEKDSKTPFLLLDSGDLFKGIYDKYASDLEKEHGVEVNFVVISSDNKGRVLF